MAVNKYGIEYVLEIQNKSEPEGFLCSERIIVRVHDDGGGPFLSLKTENLEPDETFDCDMVTLSEKDIQPICDHLIHIINEHMPTLLTQKNK